MAFSLSVTAHCTATSMFSPLQTQLDVLDHYTNLYTDSLAKLAYKDLAAKQAYMYTAIKWAHTNSTAKWVYMQTQLHWRVCS